MGSKNKLQDFSGFVKSCVLPLIMDSSLFAKIDVSCFLSLLLVNQQKPPSGRKSLAKMASSKVNGLGIRSPGPVVLTSWRDYWMSWEKNSEDPALCGCCFSHGLGMR